MHFEQQAERRRGTWVVVGALLLAVFNCGRADGGESTDSESHFLTSCRTSEECGESLECIDQVCTQHCDNASQCTVLCPTASCVTAESGLSVCDVGCSADQDCSELGALFRCEEGNCRTPGSASLPTEVPATSNSAAGSGGSTATTNDPSGNSSGTAPVQEPSGGTTGTTPEPSGDAAGMTQDPAPSGGSTGSLEPSGDSAGATQDPEPAGGSGGTAGDTATGGTSILEGGASSIPVECEPFTSVTETVDCACGGTKDQQRTCSTDREWEEPIDVASCNIDCCSEVVYCDAPAEDTGTWCRRTNESCTQEELLQDCYADIEFICGALVEPLRTDF